MTDEEMKSLEDAFEKCWDYDPSEEEVDAKYDDDFDAEIEAMIDEILKE